MMNGHEYLEQYETEDSKIAEISRLLCDGEVSMMRAFLLFELLDNCLNLFFAGIEASLVEPSYEKVELGLLIGKKVKCIWVRYPDGWVSFRDCAIIRDSFLHDESYIWFTDCLIVGRIECGVTATYCKNQEVYISDVISNIPPWGMV